MSIYKYNSTQDELTPISGSTVYADNPIGSIVSYGGATAPSGWLLCQGQAISRTIYAELFAVIGTAYGSGDGSTTFNLPDLRETIPVGVGENDVQTIADHDVYTLGEFKDDQIQNIGKMTANATNGYSVVSGGIAGYISSNSALRTGTTTHGKQLGVNYIIKAEHTAIPADFMDAVDEAVEEAAADLAPVDTVADGNMKAVTSNAVYDTLMNITTLTPTKTANVVTTYESEFLRIGRLVFVNLNLVISSGILFTGLPKPTSRQTFTINGFHETDKALRLTVNTNGSIGTDNSSTITNQNIGGHIVYVTADD